MSVEKVIVIGAGTMGHGIAHVSAMAGWNTVLCDVNQEALQKGQKAIERNLNGGVARGKLTEAEANNALGRITVDTNMESAASDATVVIEAVNESLELKHRIFQQVEPLVSPDCLLATNTSSIPLKLISEVLERKDRFIGMHFFNPVHIMALLEVVKEERTSQSAIDKAYALANAMGKEPILVKDSPGFASSRLGVVLGLEAMRMVEEGVASPEDIDKAMTLGYKHPIGPLKLTDLVGLDVRLAIAETLSRELGDVATFQPPEILRTMVKEGKLGKKTGQGFYHWE